MRKVVAADQVVSLRVSDTADEIELLLRVEGGDDMVVRLPADQLGPLAAWVEQTAARAEPEAGPLSGKGPIFPVELWTVRPEPDEEHVILGFRMGKGMEVSLRMHRKAAGAYVQALSSLLGRTLPAAPSKVRH
ncbi:MAG: hypothetical protein HYU60_05570 [Magnetospirillum sp.]|nr:hypothetical protein [Magnetospirillum sp.]